MKKETLLFFGGIREGEYENLLKKGFDLIAIVDNYLPELPKNSSVLLHIERMPLNALSSEELYHIQQLVKQYHIHSILCIIEDFLPAYVSLLTYLKKSGISASAVEKCANKTLMHQCFLQEIGPKATAQSRQITNNIELLEFANNVGYPIVIKPNGLYSSFFISCNQNEQELKHNFDLTQQSILTYLEQIHSQKNVLIQAEEYLTGSNHSVDCIVLANGEVIPTPVVDVLTGYDIGGNDFHHFARIAPSMLTTQQQHNLIELAIEGIHALGISHCIAHVELIYTPNGPRLLEIGARPGGNRINIMQQAFGIDLMMAYYQITRHSSIPNSLYAIHPPQTNFVIVTPFPIQEGLLSQINEAELINQLSTYFRHTIKKKIGDKVGTAKQGYSSPMSIELKSNDQDKIWQDIEKIKHFSSLFIITDITQ